MPFKKPAQKKAQPVVEAPSRYGSHESMVVDQVTIGDVEWVALRDEKGVYNTSRDRLDTGLADPRRYDNARAVETPNTLLKVVK